MRKYETACCGRVELPTTTKQQQKKNPELTACWLQLFYCCTQTHTAFAFSPNKSGPHGFLSSLNLILEKRVYSPVKC